MSEVREAAVAGQFYPASESELRSEVQEFLQRGADEEGRRVQALGVIAPHAGYIYSGAWSFAGYAHVEGTRKGLVVCPDHTGMGAPPASISAADRWSTSWRRASRSSR